ncbi:retrovirus-related Pol polyprotein from transposon TNT 1-94 [Trichonephila clavipes]|nr:retrovirus-related Pol polyprotein from transposon TNT 1-94 [Trichonephila clavipes]
MLTHTRTLRYSVKEFLCDNGGEFDNKDVHEILHSNGITQRLTAPYTPEQNGASEREMRTTIEMARTLKYSTPEVSFSAAIWVELVNSAIYILNRTGKSSIENTSPYELWLKKKPRLKHLRIIGSPCYAHVPAQKRRKMDKKAIQGYLVGYDGDERYGIWLKKEHKVILSRDVIFQEKAGKCDDRTELKLEDRIRGDTNQGKLKINPDGSINKYKARLVARGFSQYQGIDYSETYSPVTKLGTIRTVLSIAAEERMHLTQFDVSTTFLYGDLEETIFMKQPEGFKDGSGRVCKLKRSLYGLKQSPRCWNKCFGQFLTDLGFKASEADPCLYIRERKGRKLLIVLYVDDGLIAATDQQDSEMFIKELKTKFKISVGKVSCFLGL